MTEMPVKEKNKQILWRRSIMILIFLLIAIGISGMVAGAVFYGTVTKDIRHIDSDQLKQLLPQNSFILDNKGSVFEKVATKEYRLLTDYNHIPQHLVDAFIAIEDERFWQHSGFDTKRIIGAAWINWRTGSRQGASTITQQLVKNIFLTPEQTYSRKLKEICYAITLEKQLDKKDIMEAYLNTIYLGSGAYGIKTASQVYFSKEPSDLTLGQAALIAGITKNPSRYAPIKTLNKTDVGANDYVLKDSDSRYTIVFNENALERQRVVLKNMKKMGFITEMQYQKALQEDIKGTIKPSRLQQSAFSSYFGDLVKKDVVEALQQAGYSKQQASHLLHFGGLKIYSTLDRDIQQVAEDIYTDNTNFPGTFKDMNGNLQPQSAMVVMDYHSGQIKALMGGRMISGQKLYNRALYPRQPGSAIKPIAVYTPALEMGYRPTTMINDDVVYYNKMQSDEPWPKNSYARGYMGLISMRTALQHSSNIAAVRMADALGTKEKTNFESMLDYMQKMGISTCIRKEKPLIKNDGSYHDENFSTALGGMTKGVSPLELTAAYATLANQGVYIKPVTFTKIVNSSGKVILQNKPGRKQVISPQAAYLMTDMLQGVVDSGTGKAAQIYQDHKRIPVAGKTGTTSDQKDAWFVGYTSHLIAGVWIGSDMPRPLPQGSKMAVRLWAKTMGPLHDRLPNIKFTKPDGSLYRKPVKTNSKLTISYRKYQDDDISDTETNGEVEASSESDENQIPVEEGQHNNENEQNENEKNENPVSVPLEPQTGLPPDDSAAGF